MKHLIFILVLVASITANAQHYYSVEAGLLNNSLSVKNYEIGGLMSYKDHYSFYTDIKLGYKWKGIHAEANVFNVFNKDKSVYFRPEWVRYDFRLYYKYKSFRIGYEHSCSHPIVNSLVELEGSRFRASHDKIFIRYTFEK